MASPCNDNSQWALQKYFSLGQPELIVSNGTPERHPKSSSMDDQPLHPLTDLFEVLRKGLWGKLCLDL